MHTVATGQGQQVVEQYDATECSSCRRPLAELRKTVGWISCGCAGGRGHRWFYCLACRVFTYDPAHDEQVVNVVGGSDYFNG